LRREDDLALVQRGHGAQQVERAQVPDFGVRNDLQSVGMENTGKRLVQFVEFVDFFAGLEVPQDAIWKELGIEKTFKLRCFQFLLNKNVTIGREYQNGYFFSILQLILRKGNIQRFLF
jgi:hypothetical protein